MFSKTRKHLTYTNVAVTLALVFAMSGGAYAAGKYLITSTKQISPKVLKQLQGKAGANGAPGPAGAQGAQGPAGPQGPKGDTGGKGEKGTNGANGTNGTNGTSGATGAKGATGPEGSPWTAGGTLPAGKSESGVWGYEDGAAKAGAKSVATISYGLPLKTEPALHIIGVEEGEKEAKEAAAIKQGECKGTNAKPAAANGNLCVFVALDLNFTSLAPLVENSAGVVLWAEAAEGFVGIVGVWVVTGD